MLCLASSSSIWVWFKPSLAILQALYQICRHCVGMHKRRELAGRNWLAVSKLVWVLLEDPAWGQPGAQHGLLYPALSMFQIHRLWWSPSSCNLHKLSSLRYSLAFSVILVVSLWNSSALFIDCWDCGQQYWIQHFNSDSAVRKYMHVADSALIQYYTLYAAHFSSEIARSSTRRSENSYLGV